MENEELAALRATLLAAQRLPLAVKTRQARLSALVADGDELLPYVLARSCSDPRDRILDRDEMFQLRVLEGGSDLPRLASARRTVAVHEPMPGRPNRMAALLACLIVLCLLAQMVGMVSSATAEESLVSESAADVELRTDADSGQRPVAGSVAQLQLDIGAAVLGAQPISTGFLA